MFRAVIFFSLVTSAFANLTLDALIDAAAGFSAAIQQQLQAVESNPSLVSIGSYIVTAVGTTHLFWRQTRGIFYSPVQS
jgi:hypothetical protein